MPPIPPSLSLSLSLFSFVVSFSCHSPGFLVAFSWLLLSALSSSHVSESLVVDNYK